MRDAIRDRITEQLIGYRMKYSNGAFDHLIVYSHIMLDSDAYKTNHGWMYDAETSIVGTYSEKDGIAKFKAINIPKIVGYTAHLVKLDPVKINSKLFTRYMVSFMAMPQLTTNVANNQTNKTATTKLIAPHHDIISTKDAVSVKPIVRINKIDADAKTYRINLSKIISLLKQLKQNTITIHVTKNTNKLITKKANIKIIKKHL